MQRTVKGCGSVLITLGTPSFLIGVVLILRAMDPFYTDSYAHMVSLQWNGVVLVSGGLGTIVTGIFFLALAEILSRLPDLSDSPLKSCPQCAESVKVAARRCRCCGYDFPAVRAQSLAPPGADEPAGKMMPCQSCRRQIPRGLSRCTFCHSSTS